MIKQTDFHSKCINDIPKGCKYCVKGQKLVLFVTGLCPRSCYFCPLSDKKYHKDVIYANEKPIDTQLSEKKQIKEIILEAKTNKAKGAGITGGDPLSKLNRTVNYIKALKKEFGNNYHIHLYTSLNLVNKESLTKLYKAGLDEIRFHLDLDDKKYWKNIELALNFNWSKGIEIPVIPNKEKETTELIDYVKDKVDFINLNELEVADNNATDLNKLGFEVTDNISSNIKGSQELADKLLKHLSDYNTKTKHKINVHYCTAKLKDDVQLRNRIMLRAKNIAKYYETITKDGTIIRAIIYLNEFRPGFNYTNKINELKSDDETIVKKLKQRQSELEKLKIKTEIDLTKYRLITHMKYLKKDKLIELIKELNLTPAIVEEYPTYDAFEVDVNLF